MSSSFFEKIKALLKKDFILMKGNILPTLFEIFYPVSMFLLIYIIRKSFDKHEYDFSSHENLNGYDNSKKYYRINRSILSAIDYSITDQGNLYEKRFGKYSFDQIPLEHINMLFNKTLQIEISNNETLTDELSNLKIIYDEILNYTGKITYMGIPIVLPFNTCSSSNEDYIMKPYIGVVNKSLPIEIKNRIRLDARIGQRLALIRYLKGEHRSPYSFNFEYDDKLGERFLNFSR